ncbi:hypothetical protein P8452_48434 [Trifolium repens]|nr:hypothetical protein P8452_48434 [Trifolium repens]
MKQNHKADHAHEAKQKPSPSPETETPPTSTKTDAQEANKTTTIAENGKQNHLQQTPKYNAALPPSNERETKTKPEKPRSNT